MADIASLSLAIDSTAAARAAAELDGFVNSATRAADANSRLGGSAATAAQAQTQVAAAAETTTRAVSSSADRLIASLQRQLDLFGATDAAIAQYNARMSQMTAAQSSAYQASAALLSQLQAEAAMTAQFYAQQEAAAAAGARFVASLQTQIDTLGMSTAELQAYRAEQLGVTEQAGPLIAALEQQRAAMTAARTTNAAAGGESEEAAAARYREISAAAQEYVATQGDAATVAARYAASIDDMAASAARATGAQAALNVQVTAGAEAQSRAALIQAQNAAMSPASQAATMGGGGATEASNDAAAASVERMSQALLRQQVAVSESRAQLAAYDAALAGASEADQAYIASLAQEVEIRRAQVAIGAEMAAAMDLEAAAATRSVFASTMFVREVAVIFRELAEGRITYAMASFTRLLSFTNLLTVAFNPLTIAVGVLGYAAVKGAAQYDALNNALITSGNAAGTTAGALDAVAQRIQASGERMGVATEAVTKLAESGRFSAAQIATIGQAASAMSDTTGVAIDKVVQDFVKLQGDPVRASVELNNQYHYLTASVFDQIDALSKQGDSVGAANAAEAAYASALSERAQDARSQLGAVSSAWKDVEDAASAAWGAMLSIGKPQTLEDQLSQVTKDIAAAKAGAAGGTVGGNFNLALGTTEAVQAPGGDLAALQSQQANLQEQQRMQQRDAEGQARDAATQSAAISGRQTIDRIQQEIDKRTELTKALDQERAAVTAINAAAAQGQGTAISPAQQQQMEAGLTRRYQQPGAAAGATAQAREPQVDAQDQLNTQEHLLQNQRTILDNDHKAQLVSDQDFYNQEAALNAQDIQNKLAYYAQIENMARANAAQPSTAPAQRVRDNETVTKAQSDQTAALSNYAAVAVGVSDQVAAAQNKQTDAVQKYIDALDQAIQKAQEADAQAVGAAGGAGRTRNTAGGTAARQQTSSDIAIQGLQTRLAGGTTSQGGPITSDQYNQMVTAQQDADATIAANHQQAMAQVASADSNWSSGAVSAWSSWSKQAQDFSGQVGTATTGLLNGLTNDMVKFAETGKANFEGLAESFAQALTKMAMQAAESDVFNLMKGGIAPGGSMMGGPLGGLMQMFGMGGTTAAGGLGLGTSAAMDIGASTAGIASTMGLSSMNAFSGAFSTGLIPGALGFATGGHVTGPGTSTSDSIPARLSNGEFVVNAAATQQHRSLLETLNGGARSAVGKTHFADGGYVNSGAGVGTGSTNIGFHIYQGSGQQGQSTAQQGATASMQKQLEASVIDIVRRNSLPGGQIQSIIRTASAQ
jgi:phage-related minor tail protein